jgi:hypothetical protein
MQNDNALTIPLAIGGLVLLIGGVAFLIGSLEALIMIFQDLNSFSIILLWQVTWYWLFYTWPGLLALIPAVLIIQRKWISIWMALVSLVCSVPALATIAWYVHKAWLLLGG